MEKNLIEDFELAVSQGLKDIKSKYNLFEPQIYEKICPLHKMLENKNVRIDIFLNSPELNFIISPIKPSTYIKQGASIRFPFSLILNYLIPNNNYKGDFLPDGNDFYKRLLSKIEEISVFLEKDEFKKIFSGDFSVWPNLEKIVQKINEDFMK